MTDELRARAEARIGTLLRERYRIEALLGMGGMAAVYLATHRNKKRFAIKMLHPELAIQSETKQRFIREGYVANTVDHVGAVSVIDDDVTEDGTPFLVMELLDGAEVGELAEKSGNALQLPLVLAIADQVLAVLEAAHAHGVVHRDLKPANLFITRDGTVKVLDFGIARLREAMAAGPGALTQTGALMGTPAFLPPEQAGGKTRDVDHQTDLWALGATMFTLLTGQYVHDAENATQIIILAATQPARSLATAMPHAAPHVIHLIDRALAFDKSVRWANAATMRAATREAYRVVTGGSVPTRETLAQMFGIGTWETKYGEMLQPPTSALASAPMASAAPGPHGHVGTTPMPIGSRHMEPTAPTPVQSGALPIVATATPVARSIAFASPRKHSTALYFGIACALLGIGAGAGALVIHGRQHETPAVSRDDALPGTAAASIASIASTASIASVAPSASATMTATPPPRVTASATPFASAASAASIAATKPLTPVVTVKPASSGCLVESIDTAGEKHFTVGPCR